jgi:hypothetical protein
MTVPENHDSHSEDGATNVDGATAVERLERTLGGELTRFLVSALARAQASSRGEPR